jgi:hypothetical protein
MSRIASLFLIACLLGACTTFAPFGLVENRRNDARGDPRSERIFGLIALPTPSGDTVILIPLHKSWTIRQGRSGALPLPAQQWQREQPPISPNIP